MLVFERCRCLIDRSSLLQQHPFSLGLMFNWPLYRVLKFPFSGCPFGCAGVQTLFYFFYTAGSSYPSSFDNGLHVTQVM